MGFRKGASHDVSRPVDCGENDHCLKDVAFKTLALSVIATQAISSIGGEPHAVGGVLRFRPHRLTSVASVPESGNAALQIL